MLHSHLRLLLASVLLIAALGVQAQEKPTDPAIFIAPKNALAFRELLKGEAWTKQFAAATARLGNLEELQKSARPVAGTLVVHVNEKGQAVDLAIGVGDIITEIDGQPVNQKSTNDMRRDEDQPITVVSADGKLRPLTVHAGPIGFNGIAVVYPERIYLRQGVRDAKWDAFAAVGAATCIENPDLAETAWHHAIQAGYVPDVISDYCGCQIAWRQGRADETVAFCARFAACKNIPAALDPERFCRQIAVSHFKIEQAVAGRMAADPGEPANADPAADYFRQLLDAHRQLAPAQRLMPAPSEIAQYVKTDLMKDLEPRFQTTDEADHRWQTDVCNMLAKREQWLKMPIPSAHYRTLIQAPKVPAADVELIVRAKLRLSDDHDSQFGRVLVVSLVNCDKPEYLSRSWIYQHGEMLHVNIEPFGVLSCSRGARAEKVRMQLVEVAEEIAGGRQFTLRLLHAAGRDEVWINRRRVLYLPSAENPAQIGIYLHAVGVNVDLKTDFARLDPSAVANP